MEKISIFTSYLANIILEIFTNKSIAIAVGYSIILRIKHHALHMYLDAIVPNYFAHAIVVGKNS